MKNATLRTVLLSWFLAGLAGEAPAQESSSGIPLAQILGGAVQPPHTSPILLFEAVQGAGLEGSRPPGMAAAPVLPFIPRLRQHRDSRPLASLPLVSLDRAPGDMPYRNDHVRLPPGDLETLQRSARPFVPAVGYSGPGDTVEGFARLAVREPQVYVRAFSRVVDARNGFADGSGNDVPFEYRRNQQQLVLGWTPTPAFELFGVFVRDEIDDDATPSANLDNVETDRLIGRTGFEYREGLWFFDRVRGEVRYRSAERTNNNFDVRDFVFRPGARRTQVENERQFVDGRLFGDFAHGDFQHRFGIDWIVEHRDGSRFADLDPRSPQPVLDGLSAPLFPDISITEIGPTWEGAFSFSEDDHVRLGASYRHVRADADNLEEAGDGPFALLAPGVPSTAINLYEFYYGDTEVEQTDHLVNARVVYQRELADDRLTLFGELARIDRAADSKERFWAGLAPGANASRRLVGNPELEPERHYQVALGFDFDGPDWISFGRARRTGETILTGAWRVAGALRFSRVHDFITRDRARLQAGVLQDDRALIFRNVDVNMVTAELDALWNVTPNLSARGNLVYSFAENESEGRPLYGIAPLEANLLIDYSDQLGTVGTWSVGGKLRLVADQTRVDDDPATGAGFDEGETDGFAVLDLYAGAQIHDRVALRVGVENVFDETYQEHVARSTLDSIQRRRINAPGRSVFVRGVITF